MHLTTILIVEDERIVALDIKRQLIKLGYKVLAVVSTGEEAILKVNEKKPDIIIMDIFLKGKLNGIEAASLIKKVFNIPIIFLTASTDTKTFEAAQSVDPAGYIIKPFHIEEVKVTIETALHKAIIEQKLGTYKSALKDINNLLSDNH